MPRKEPITELDPRFSSEDARATAWADAQRELEHAQVYWLSTVRADGRPHVTPLIAVWLDGVAVLLHRTDGAEGQEHRPQPALRDHDRHQRHRQGPRRGGRGRCGAVDDDDELRRVAEAYETKYGTDWHFDVKDGAFRHEAGEAWVFVVAPVKTFGFAKGEPFSQTRFRFTG